MDKKILIINSGSSSIKYKVFLQSNNKVIASGLTERIYLDGNFKIKYYDKNGNLQVVEQKINLPSHDVAVEVILKNLIKYNVVKDLTEFVGVGHRVVQGGSIYKDSSLINAKCLKDIDHLSKLAPLHNPSELKVINIFRKKLPKAKEVAAFDTSFHTSIPANNYIYPINKKVAEKYEIRRYGAHGISYKFITKKMQEILKKKTVNLIVCHVGNGASVCAIKNSKSFNTSMGLTPLEGLMMGTRCGTIDPSIATYLMRCGMNDQQIDDLFNKKSGLFGLVGSGDLRDVLKMAKKDKLAKLALDIYTTRITEYIVKYANELEGKIDAIIFTAGVGENQMDVVCPTLNKVKLFKIDLNMKEVSKKYDEYKKITSAKSKYPVYIVRTDEELMIAQDVERLTK